MEKRVTAGVIGASLQRGWASKSHVPAISGTRGLELGGVTGRTQKEADEAAREFKATRGYASVESMIGDPEIDLITVAVRVPSHRDLVLKALHAGKHVYCEWPLGIEVREAEELRDAAVHAGVHVAIGLQARRNASLMRARALLSNGVIGRVLSTRMYSATVAFGATEGDADSYLEDPANGATHLTIHGGHALDAAIAVLGPLDFLDAIGTTQYKHVDIGEGQRTLLRTIPDHLLIQATVQNSFGLGIEVDGGRPEKEARFQFEVTGERGTMMLKGSAPMGFQAAQLNLWLNGQPEVVDEGEVAHLPEFARNVGAMYAALRDDIVNGEWTVPDFDHAVKLSKLLRDADHSMQSGKRSHGAEWPEH